VLVIVNIDYTSIITVKQDYGRVSNSSNPICGIPWGYPLFEYYLVGKTQADMKGCTDKHDLETKTPSLNSPKDN